MRATVSRAFPILSLFAYAACAAPSNRVDLAELEAQHERYLAEFHAIQDEVSRKNPMPQRLEFPGHGTILIDELDLEGRPGKEYLRAHFTYVNSTGQLIDTARVTLTLRDSATGEEWAETMDLSLPYKYSLTRDSSYTSWFEMPTEGLHRRPEWQWAMSVEAFREPPPK